MKWTALGILLMMGSITHARNDASPEFRGIWVDGFNEGIKTREQVDTLLKRVRSANMNAVVVQVRKRGDAYYNSHYEPRATDMAPGFDSLGYLVEKAHSEKPYVEVHAWLNACAVGGNPDPQSITSLHRDYLSLSDIGEDYDREATKIDPGHPGALEWTVRCYLDVIRQYDVDAVHFDFIRYGGRNWGYNPTSLQRFRERYNIPADDKPRWYDWRWMKWRRDNITNIVRKVYALGMDANPKARLSAATICWGNGPDDLAAWMHRSSAYMAIWQDWRAWMEEGLLDMNIPMAYFQETRNAAFWDNWTRFIKDHRYGRRAAPGAGVWLNTIPQSISQLAETRLPTDAGNHADGLCMYAYSGTHRDVADQPKVDKDGFFTAVREGLFPAPAPLPDYPERDRPTDALVKGTLLRAADGGWCDPADVKLWRGRRLINERMTDGTGFYAFVHLPPGRYTVEARYKGDTIRHIVDLKAGNNRTQDFLFGLSDTRRYTTTWAVNRATVGQRALLQRWVVMHDMPGRSGLVTLAPTSGDNAGVVCSISAPLILPLVKGDIVTVIGTVAETEDGRMLTDANAQVVGIARR